MTTISKDHLRLNTLTLNTIPSAIIALRKYGKLARSKDPFITTSIFNRIMTLFFRSNISIKHKIKHFMKKHAGRFKYADPTVFKSDLLNSMLSLDIDTVECVKEIIKTFNVLLHDDEILCEYVFLDDRYKQLDFYAKVNEGEIAKEEIIEEIICRTRYKSIIGNLGLMIEYVKKWRNKYTVKLLVRYPVLVVHVESFVVGDKCFLSKWEAERLYKYFGIFVPAWNKSNFVIVRWSGANSLAEKYVFLKSFLRSKRNGEAAEILRELKDVEGLRVDYRAMFEYLYERLVGGKRKCCDLLVKLYGINRNKEFMEVLGIIEDRQTNHFETCIK